MLVTELHSLPVIRQLLDIKEAMILPDLFFLL